jgi:hypothetical protein
MPILDGSGNNLDAPNLRRVSQALQQIANKVDLTAVLACRDLYGSLVSECSMGMIQLVRASTQDVLNVLPVILQGGATQCSPLPGAVPADGEARRPCLVGLRSRFTYVNLCSNSQS